MKESAGELNMTVVTVAIIAVLLLVGLAFKDNITEWVGGIFNPTTTNINNDENPL